jgi:hypothetical protein
MLLDTLSRENLKQEIVALIDDRLSLERKLTEENISTLLKL